MRAKRNHTAMVKSATKVADSKSAAGWLDASSVDAGLVLRIVAGGMGEHAVLRRLFEAPLAADRFPDSYLYSAGRTRGTRH